MVLELHGSTHSTCSQRVLTVAHELGVDLPIVAVDFAKGEHKSPEISRINPSGRSLTWSMMALSFSVGGLVCGTVHVQWIRTTESRAIARYLARKFGNGKLLPDQSNIQAVALLDQGASIEMADFEPSVSGILWEKVFGPYHGHTCDEAQLEKHIKTLKGKLEGYERILSKQKYLCGDELTVVDLFHLPHGTRSEPFIPGLFEEHPHVAKWWEDLKARDSWVKASAPAA